MYLKMSDLSGRVTIVTGGAGLLGRQYAVALAQAGAHVVIADINLQAAENLAYEVTQSSKARALGIQTDVSSNASVQAMIAQTIAEFGRVDILVNNAALDPKFDPDHASEQINSFEEYPLQLWNDSLAVNVTGMFLCAQAVAPTMLAQQKGVIVNVSSIYGLVGPDQRIYQSDSGGTPVYKPVTYSVTKSAVLGLTSYLATYWANKNIRVNTLTLGGVFNNHEEQFVKNYSYRTPLGRMAEKEEYCGALLFLVSDASSYMTGSNLVIDGGWTAW
ncbi:SDR family oxidoreductase [Candidatus Nitronereus thalassa]|uniref:SDR family oxidoreductase n=1 Tax=Candidatus Nitronereus thalassa TaxID=3020898 RepID=A0ABU3K5A3_9BACT|nr:SDR family oxidoreductase [Candidatus Nitronereus thalassa]MDT7041541.1 SDR family oxidoreductase [Candidatus Nitronereus thalassa]